MSKLKRMINDQIELSNYMNSSKTREERYQLKRYIDELELKINQARKELGLQ